MTKDVCATKTEEDVWVRKERTSEKGAGGRRRAAFSRGKV